MTEQRCECHACIKRFNLTDDNGWPINAGRMILCPLCGNKRCPRASNHELPCTNSNKPGQDGSVYA